MNAGGVILVGVTMLVAGVALGAIVAYLVERQKWSRVGKLVIDKVRAEAAAVDGEALAVEAARTDDDAAAELVSHYPPGGHES